MLALNSPDGNAAPSDWRELARAGRLVDAVAACVAEHDPVTLAALQQRFAPYLPVYGSFSYDVPDYPNTVLWWGVSEEFCHLLTAVFLQRRAFPWPATRGDYAQDGAALRLPLARQPRPGGYVTPHWLPIQLRPFRFEARHRWETAATRPRKCCWAAREPARESPPAKIERNRFARSFTEGADRRPNDERHCTR